MTFIALLYALAAFGFLAKEKAATRGEIVSALTWPATRAYRFVRARLGN